MATRPRLILHAGLGKTGSSAIQKYLREHADALAAEGVVYLGMELERGGRTRFDFDPEEPVSGLIADPPDDPRALQRQIVSLVTEKMALHPDAHSFVWSQVAMAPAHALLAPVVRRLAKIADVEIVLYFRHQADWLVSAFLQWGVKHKTYAGPMRDFAGFLPLAEPRGSDYRAVIEGWRAIRPATVHVRSYDAAPDAVADFIATARLGTVAPDRAAHQHYGTPDPALLGLFRLHQGQSEGEALPFELLTAMTRAGIADKAYRPVDPRLGLPQGEAWSAFVDSFAEGNRALEEEFGLTLRPPVEAPAELDAAAAPAALVAPLIDLVLALDRRVASLEARLGRAGKGSG